MRNRATTRTLAAAGLAAALGLAACSGESDAGSVEVTEEEAASAVEDMEPLPTEEELEAQAAEEITEENADAAYEALKREIEGG